MNRRILLGLTLACASSAMAVPMLPDGRYDTNAMRNLSPRTRNYLLTPPLIVSHTATFTGTIVSVYPISTLGPAYTTLGPGYTTFDSGPGSYNTNQPGSVLTISYGPGSYYTVQGGTLTLTKNYSGTSTASIVINGAPTSGSTTVVPEPSSLVLTGGALLALAQRRRRTK